MKRHLLTCLISVAVMVLGQACRAQSIVAVHDASGKTVWVNDDDAPKPPAPPASTSTPKVTSRTPKLVYWSSKEHRWKPVPLVSPASMRAARQAADEVASRFNSVPRANSTASRKLMASHPVSDLSDLSKARIAAPEAVDREIEAAAERHGVDPNLVRAMVKVESDFNPRAVSRKGAMGLMQLMPSTARSMKVNNAFDPRQNVDAGVRHLKTLLENYNGNLELSLAAYNAGSGAVNRNGGIPPYRETRDYVKRITDLYWNGGTLSPLRPRLRVTEDANGHPVYSNQ